MRTPGLFDGPGEPTEPAHPYDPGDPRFHAWPSDRGPYWLWTSWYRHPVLPGVCRFAGDLPPMLLAVRLTQARPPADLGYGVLAAPLDLIPSPELRGFAGRPDAAHEFARAYREQLDRVGPWGAAEPLVLLSADHGNAPVVLLGFEAPGDPPGWAPRRVFAEWWRDRHGVAVPELKP